MFLPNSHSFLSVRSVSKPVIQSDIHESASSIPLSSSSVSFRKMFLPNSHSFLSVRSVQSVTTPQIVQSDISDIHESASSIPLSSSSVSVRKMFLPNSYSFLSVRSILSEPAAESEIQEFVTQIPRMTSLDSGRKMFLSSSHSFSLVISKPVIESDIPESGVPLLPPSSSDSDNPTIGDKDKRTFLKVAGVAGVSLAGSLLLPKKAEALIMGSAPTTGVVGVKDATNARINPATEETVDSLLKTSDLTFDAGSLQVKVTSLPGAGSSSFSDSGDVAKSGLVDGDRHVQVDVLSSALPASASTETTLQTISFGGFKFALRLATVGSIDYVGEAAIGTATSAASWRIKKIDSTTGIVIQWAGTGVFDQVWDNRASLTYT